MFHLALLKDASAYKYRKRFIGLETLSKCPTIYLSSTIYQNVQRFVGLVSSPSNFLLLCNLCVDFFLIQENSSSKKMSNDIYPFIIKWILYNILMKKSTEKKVFWFLQVDQIKC